MKYKVIEIVSEKEIIIDFGQSQGAKIGDRILIYSLGREVYDPTTNKKLGTWDISKAYLSITEVFENFSICKNKIVTENSLLNPLGTVFNKSVTYEKINVDESAITNNKNLGTTPIKVGDLAKRV